MRTITVPELYAMTSVGQAVDLIDVRAPFEYREVHAACARNVPLDSLDPAEVMQSRSGRSDLPLHVICWSGGRSKQACDKFIAAGFSDVVNVEGGTQAWIAAGFPLVRGKAAVSLERQVRIAVGLMVMASVALGWWVHPGFLGVTAFLGAGLVYAGVTNRCGMAMLLVRMPWNRAAPASCCCGKQADSC